MHSKLLAQIVLSSSPAASDPLLPTWMSLILSVLFVLVFSDVTARYVRMSNRHLLISVFSYHMHIPCNSLNSSSFPLFDSLCLSDFVFVRIHPCFSRQSSLNDCPDSLSLHSSLRGFVAFFHAMQALRILGSLQCVRELQHLRTSRRIFWVQLLELFQPQSLAMVVPLLLFVSCDFLGQLQSGATICHGVPHKPSQFVDSQASLSVCLVQLLPRTNAFVVMRKTAPVQS